MNPIKTRESNFTYLGPTPEVADLPCRTEGPNTFSVWELTPDERRLIADGANVRLGIHGMRPIPPVSLQVVGNDGPYARVADPCTVCGRGVEDAAHLSGPGTHAFKSEPHTREQFVPKKYG